MTRTLAIAKRILMEMMRDKRTLALMFLAPVLILSLLNYVFTINSTPSVEIGTVRVEQVVSDSLNQTSHVQTKNYVSEKKAKVALKDKKVDAVLTQTGENQYQIRYANTDASKTAMVRQVVNGTFTKNKVAAMTKQNVTLAAQNGQQAAAQSSVFLSEKYNYGDQDTSFFDTIMPIFMGFFVFMFVFLISGISLLKERTKGTLSRLLATPVRRSEIVFGYMLSYALIAVLQTAVIVTFTITLLHVEVLGSVWLLFLINVLLAMVALALGLLVSTLAASEFQMIQFIPIVVVPQMIFSGIIPFDSMASWAQAIGNILPMKYAADAMNAVVLQGQGLSAILWPIFALVLFLVALTGLNIFGLRRYRKV
ncbi:ABC transporter permease [Fructobacillus sp. M158]|uniref:ABC transporter permease n=1 Tax=Fructobacillus parabroussonetiae TaxID=2713174 RepID=UPI00200B6FBB|nr:ABC transporter permease [Fructobacillus parabroussonetiae]MCK8617068.1 ABC transporter permease [Fructobacillus parabroussonetiae]